MSSVGPTFWFGGTVKDSNPHKIGQEGFLELQFYPDSMTKKCFSNGGFNLVHAPNVYTACSPVWTIAKQGKQIAEGRVQRHAHGRHRQGAVRHARARHRRRPHLGAFVGSAYQEQVTDETSGAVKRPGTHQPEGRTAYSRVRHEPDRQRARLGRRLGHPDGVRVEIGHSDLYGDHPLQFCVPGQTFCGSFNTDNWLGFTPIRIFDATFGDGSHQQNWAVVSDTGGKAEVLGNSFVGPTECSGYGGPFCTYPFFSWDGTAINYGADFPDTVDALGGADQFAQTQNCPEDGIFAGNTYCDTIVK